MIRYNFFLRKLFQISSVCTVQWKLPSVTALSSGFLDQSVHVHCTMYIDVFHRVQVFVVYSNFALKYIYKFQFAWAISQKLRIEKKNHLSKKWASGQFQSTLQIWPLLKKVEFLSVQNAPFGRPNAIWWDKKFYSLHFFSTFRIFYVKMVTFEKKLNL